MCLSPISVDVAKKQRYFNLSGLIMSHTFVPCGKCEECKSTLRNDEYLRIREEYKNCVSFGGKALFLTFTYTDDNVPVLNYRLSDDGTDLVPSFSRGVSDPFMLYRFDKHDIQKFFNSLRKQLERKGLVNCLRYYVVSEYGADIRYTQRPHYHVIIFASRALCTYYDDFCDVGTMRFIRACALLWDKGIVSASQKGLVIESDDCARYCAKYLGKNIDLSKNIRFSSLYKFIASNLPSLFPSDFVYSKSVDSLFLYYLRKFGCRYFTLKSKYFGYSLIFDFDEDLSNHDYQACAKRILDGISIPDLSKGQSFKYNYPQYILNHLFYNNLEDGSRQLTKCGYEIKRILLHDAVNTFVDNVLTIQRDDLFDYFASCSSYSLDSDDFNYAIDWFFDYRRSFDLYSFAIYSFLLRQRYVSKSQQDTILNILYSDSISVSDKIDSFYRFVYGFHNCDPETFLHSSNSHDLLSSFSLKHRFKKIYIPDYELFYTVVTGCLNFKRATLVNDNADKQRKSKLLSDILNFNTYGFS